MITAIVILALLGMLALGVLLGWALDFLSELEVGGHARRTGQGCLAMIGTQNIKRYRPPINRSSSTKTRAGACARAIYIAPKMVLPHGDTQIIDLTGWKRRRTP